MLDQKTVVMTSINGRPATENMKVAVEDLVSEVKDRLEDMRKNNWLSVDRSHVDAPKKEAENLRRLLEELREICHHFASFNEMLAMFPPWVRIMHTRSREATSTDYMLYRFIQIGAYAIGLDATHPPLIMTPEDCQDAVTLRYKTENFTPEDLQLCRRLESLDRITVLKLWADGHPLHQGLVPYLENLVVVHASGIDEICLMTIPLTFMWNKEHQLRQNKWIDGVWKEIPDFEHGICVPDHSCCNQHGMFNDAFRRVVFESPVEHREHIQIENLTQRMKAEYEAQKAK
jgi:hypothetical protein